MARSSASGCVRRSELLTGGSSARSWKRPRRATTCARPAAARPCPRCLHFLMASAVHGQGTIGFHYDNAEITPHVPNSVEAFFDADDAAVDALSPAEEARAVIEARFISMRVHAEFIGLKMDRIYATGGASQNTDITQVISDVFGCDVYTMASPGGAPLGAAYRALHATKCDEAGEYVRLCPRYACISLLRTPTCFAVEAGAFRGDTARGRGSRCGAARLHRGKAQRRQPCRLFGNGAAIRRPGTDGHRSSELEGCNAPPSCSEGHVREFCISHFSTRASVIHVTPQKLRRADTSVGSPLRWGYRIPEAAESRPRQRPPSLSVCPARTGR